MRPAHWVFLGTLGLVALGTLYGGYRFASEYYDFPAASAELDDAARAYRAEGLPFVARDIAPPHVDADRNAAPAIRAAVAILPPKRVEAGLERALRKPGPTDGALVAQYAKGLTLLDAVRDRSRADFVRNWDLGYDLEFPEFQGMKALARAASLRAIGEAKRKDDAAALRDLDLAQRIGRWAGDEPTMIAMLVRIGIESTALDAAARCLAGAKGDRNRIALYARWAQTPAPPLDFRRALRGEAWTGVVATRNLDRMVKDADGDDHLDPHRLRRDGLPEDQRQRAFMTRLLQVWIEGSRETEGFRKTPREVGRRTDAIEERWYRKRGFSRMMATILFPNLGGAGNAVVALDARRSVLRGLAEAMDSEARTGHWPTAVAGKDPFTGRPLRVRAGKEYRVYSVGSDGKDDGGRLRREAPKTSGATFDEVAACPPVP